MLRNLLSRWSWIIGSLTVLILIASFALLEPRIGGAEEEQVLLISKSAPEEIKYHAFFDTLTQEVYGGVTYDYFSSKGIKAYIDFNRTASREIAQRLNDSLSIKVVFSHPLSQAAFEQFVKTYHVEVHSYTMRAVDSNGMRITIAGGPEDGELVPQNLLKMVTGDITDRNSAEIKGWIEAEITTTPQDLDKMQHDPDVFVTEATYTLIYDALTPENLERAGATRAATEDIRANRNRSVQITGPSLYWNLEDEGLVEMPVHSQASE